MIAFRKGWEPNNDNVEKLVEKLKSILGNLNVEYDEAESYGDNFYSSISISEIIQLIYNAMYQNDNEMISLIINKNENNSLDVSIDYIK